jgi:hypothetical protein
MLCYRCEKEEAKHECAYCEECLTFFAEQHEGIHRKQRPAEAIYADGQFAKPEDSPVSFITDIGETACGLCGDKAIESGYGLGSGFGIGSYNFCNNCGAFLDFCEDTGE